VARAAANGQKPAKVEIHRTDAQGRDVKYYILDNPALLSREDWLLRRVLAVFAAGPEWQFKGWKWGAERKGEVEPPDVPPVKIFSMGACGGRCACPSPAPPSRSPPRPARTQHNTPPPLLRRAVLGFHLHYEGDPPHENASQWAVKCIPVSKTQRFLDSGVARRFWAVVDQEVSVRRPHLAAKE
jgi:hypothetical protein